VVHHLPHSPSARPVRCVELGIAQAVHRGTQSLRQLAQDLDLRIANRRRAAGWRAEAANRKPGIFEFCHGWNFTMILCRDLVQEASCIACPPITGVGGLAPAMTLLRGQDPV
jgi:hypothetical protein